MCTSRRKKKLYPTKLGVGTKWKSCRCVSHFSWKGWEKSIDAHIVETPQCSEPKEALRGLGQTESQMIMSYLLTLIFPHMTARGSRNHWKSQAWWNIGIGNRSGWVYHNSYDECRTFSLDPSPGRSESMMWPFLIWVGGSSRSFSHLSWGAPPAYSW